MEVALQELTQDSSIYLAQALEYIAHYIQGMIIPSIAPPPLTAAHK